MSGQSIPLGSGQSAMRASWHQRCQRGSTQQRESFRAGTRPALCRPRRSSPRRPREGSAVLHLSSRQRTGKTRRTCRRPFHRSFRAKRLAARSSEESPPPIAGAFGTIRTVPTTKHSAPRDGALAADFERGGSTRLPSRQCTVLLRPCRQGWPIGRRATPQLACGARRPLQARFF